MTEDLEQAEQVRTRGGGVTATNTSARDSRVTAAIAFLQPIISGFVVAAVIYFANQVGSLKDAMVETNKQLALNAQQNNRMVEDFRDHEGRLRALEGRNLRGFHETPKLPSEVARGN